MFDGQHLSDLLQGLQDNQLLGGYTHLLTGGVGGAAGCEEGLPATCPWTMHHACFSAVPILPLPPVGYIGSVSLLETIAEVSRKLKAANSQVTYGGWTEGPHGAGQTCASHVPHNQQ